MLSFENEVKKKTGEIRELKKTSKTEQRSTIKQERDEMQLLRIGKEILKNLSNGDKMETEKKKQIG